MFNEFIFNKIKVGIKAKVDNLIIFFPPTSIPCKIGCKKINKQNDNVYKLKIVFFFNLNKSIFKYNKLYNTRGPKLKNGHTKNINNSFKDLFSIKIPNIVI